MRMLYKESSKNKVIAQYHSKDGLLQKHLNSISNKGATAPSALLLNLPLVARGYSHVWAIWVCAVR